MPAPVKWSWTIKHYLNRGGKVDSSPTQPRLLIAHHYFTSHPPLSQSPWPTTTTQTMPTSIHLLRDSRNTRSSMTRPPLTYSVTRITRLLEIVGICPPKRGPHLIYQPASLGEQASVSIILTTSLISVRRVFRINFRTHLADKRPRRLRAVVVDRLWLVYCWPTVPDGTGRFFGLGRFPHRKHERFEGIRCDPYPQ